MATLKHRDLKYILNFRPERTLMQVTVCHKPDKPDKPVQYNRESIGSIPVEPRVKHETVLLP